MSNRNTWLMAFLGAGVLTTALSTWGQEPKPTKLSADEVVKLWSPNLKSATSYHQTGGSPKQSNVAAYSFRVVGPSFEELWNHYAKLCGMKQQYAEGTILVAADAGPNGSYVVSDRTLAGGKGERGLSVFLLKTDAYTVIVTIQIDPDRKSISGSLSAVVQ